MATARISVPARASAGEIVDVKTLFSHPMETGYRRDTLGAPIPRNIVREFVCTYDGRVVFRAELEPGIAANPFFAFSLRADRSGELAFRWTDQDGVTTVETRALAVDP